MPSGLLFAIVMTAVMMLMVFVVFMLLFMLMVMTALMLMFFIIVIMMMAAAMVISAVVIVIMIVLVVAAAVIMIIMLAVSVYVNMAMTDFGFRGLANIEHINMKLQGKTGQRMVAVNHNVITGKRLNEYGLLTGIRISKEGISHMDFHITEHGSVHSLNQSGISESVSLFRSHSHINSVSGLMSYQCFFKAGNYRSVAYQHLKSILIIGSIKYSVILICYNIINRNNRILLNLHKTSNSFKQHHPAIISCTGQLLSKKWNPAV